jgi:acetoin:2,6-dichlorophenolindophenol oxidoreductase subunit alpha
LNMASLWKLPVIFFCENNLYAVTTSVAQSHGQPDIAKRADGYGMPGLAIDGQDFGAVYEATREAVRLARDGRGPTLIEARTYRFDEHQVGLTASRYGPYRADAEVEEYLERRDPVVLFGRLLAGDGVADEELDAMDRQVADEVARAIAYAERSPLPEPGEVYSYMYVNPINYPATVGGGRV